MLVVVAPGQGSQTPGMLAPWLNLPAFAAVIDAMSSASGLDLRTLGTQADADTIRDTSIAQPLIVAASLASASALGIHQADYVAGHSVGEITAAALAGVFSITDAAELVTTRGEEMAHAAKQVSTSMAAVLGGDRDVVVSELESRGLTAANQNGAGQIVAAGTTQQIEELMANPIATTKVIQLQVAGAFHTHYMAAAQDAVRTKLAQLTVHEPSITLVSNKGGDVVNEGNEFAQRLVSQITSSVRWDSCMETMRAHNVTGLIELFPGGTLTGIAKRAMPGVELLPIKNPDNAEQIADFVARHLGVESVAS